VRGELVALATGVQRVSEAELREIIEANSKTLDPDTVLTP